MKWLEMSYNRRFSRNDESEKEVDEIIDGDFYGLYENLTICNCLSVEDVYNGMVSEEQENNK